MVELGFSDDLTLDTELGLLAEVDPDVVGLVVVAPLLETGNQLMKLLDLALVVVLATGFTVLPEGGLLTVAATEVTATVFCGDDEDEAAMGLDVEELAGVFADTDGVVLATGV
eukprot:CAMPEP_0116880180 /NCGR_PEP_ID=MMETSP0463-20121206/12079_1 /TAXON_ID=181622 /ORGANISM="Strombidinopsis sp, Strain SopsisLIS2011" /LENGTH=112 /DNA_ID=CAMNT_0004530441 /DNA_START=977 /DNA_END=1315 /DNA_ORIENTATION=+